MTFLKREGGLGLGFWSKKRALCFSLVSLPTCPFRWCLWRWGIIRTKEYFMNPPVTKAPKAHWGFRTKSTDIYTGFHVSCCLVLDSFFFFCHGGYKNSYYLQMSLSIMDKVAALALISLRYIYPESSIYARASHCLIDLGKVQHNMLYLAW